MKIKPESFIRLPFTVTVPEGTPPGEYVAGFLARLEEQPDGSTGLGENTVNIKVVTQIGIAIVIRVPGESTCSVTVTDFKFNPSNTGWHFNISLLNGGTEPFKGTGKFMIKQGETEIASKDIKQGYSVAGLPFIYRTDLEPAAAGEYTAILNINNNTDPDCSISYTSQVVVSKDQSKQMSSMVAEVEKHRVTAQPTTVAGMVENNGNNLAINSEGPINNNNNKTMFYISLVVFAMSAIMVCYVVLRLKKHK